MAKLTSRVPDTWYALYKLLDDQTWPLPPTGGDPPSVIFGAEQKVLPEAVVVVGTPNTQSTLETVTNLSEGELFTLLVYVRTDLPGLSVLQAFERLKELGDVVQNALRNTATGRQSNAFNAPQGQTATHPVDGVISWRVSQYRAQMRLIGGGGLGGYGELDVLFKTRI